MREQPLRHLTTIKSLSQKTIHNLLAKSEHYLKNNILQNTTCNILQGQIVTNLFFESSTRTRHSFIVAAKRLNAIVLNPHLPHTAISKGESLLDTIHTFEAIGTRFFVIRHADNGVPEWIATQVKKSSIINGGDGTNQHPTQALLDLLTIHQRKNNWKELTVAIIGDIVHSRVANSLIDALSILKISQIRLVGPSGLLPSYSEQKNISIHHALEDGIRNADVIVALRLQKERVPDTTISEFKTFHENFYLSAEKLSLAKPDAIVMHPGPMNRHVEIAPEVADGPQSVILQQVQNGVAVRMAVFDLLSGNI